jgi:hypothetical protein
MPLLGDRTCNGQGFQQMEPRHQCGLGIASSAGLRPKAIIALDGQRPTTVAAEPSRRC